MDQTMAQAPILAAGGIVVRGGRKPLIAIVQRRKDNRWVLPKGKLKPREKPIAAARREVVEETGYDVFVHEFLGVISYAASGSLKVAQFWRMHAVGRPAHKVMDDIKAVEWLPLASAIDRLSQPHEQIFLRSVGHALATKGTSAARKPAAAHRRAASRQAASAAASPVSPQAHALAPSNGHGDPAQRPNLIRRTLRRFIERGGDAQAGTPR
jgi:8-oxo-dGTP diphosphatase